MAIKVGKLWGKGSFHSLSKEAKLLYVYLITAPELDILGLLNISLVRIELDLGFTEGMIRSACTELVEDHIRIYKNNTQFYFFILGHFDTNPRSDATSKKAMAQIKLVPDKVLDMLVSDGLMPNIEMVSEFEEPSVEEVIEYGLSQGYIVNGQEFVDFYRSNAERLGKKGWYDGRGKQVRDWKAKLRKVWFRNATKLEKVDGAPKGFEHFYVIFEGKVCTPDRWVDGKPKSSNLALDMTLKDKFNSKKL